MENASKALIIAGAILLSILIIALGIYVYNMAAGTLSNNPFDEMQISQFNEPFETYASDRILGSSVKKLLDKLISNTSTNSNSADRLPDVHYLDDDGSGNSNGPKTTSVTGVNNPDEGETVAAIGSTRGLNITSNVDSPSTKAMTALKAVISNSHYYKVYYEYDTTTALICDVYIDYNP